MMFNSKSFILELTNRYPDNKCFNINSTPIDCTYISLQMDQGKKGIGNNIPVNVPSKIVGVAVIYM